MPANPFVFLDQYVSEIAANALPFSRVRTRPVPRTALSVSSKTETSFGIVRRSIAFLRQLNPIGCRHRCIALTEAIWTLVEEVERSGAAAQIESADPAIGQIQLSRRLGPNGRAIAVLLRLRKKRSWIEVQKPCRRVVTRRPGDNKPVAVRWRRRETPWPFRAASGCG